MFIFSLFNLEIYFLPINNRLQISFFNQSFSRPLNSFNSFMFSYISLSVNWTQVNYLFWFRDEFKLFSLVDYFLFNNWLVKYFSLRSLEIFNNNFFWVFNWICFFRILESLGFLLLYINKLLLNIFDWLNVLFSVSYLPRYFYRNFVYDLFIINNGLILNSLSINRSGNFFLSNHWCLHDSLLDNRLSNYSLGNNRLTYHRSLNLGLTNNLLTLGDLGSWVKNLIS